ncbi:hypothetical protein BGZ79_000251 [Entomortierella chlamydospora]|nr:hypothetical protein BGZ79_000251 [Entomortierella chlamydospora]
MTNIVGPKHEEFDRIRRHNEAFLSDSWDPHTLNTEHRVFFILNRYTRGLVIMYASSACQSAFHIDPYDIEGKPILLFVRSDDLEMFVEQLDLVKSKDKIVNMRFRFQSPNWPREIPCEAVFIGSSDGILAVMRVCKPFVRKHLITDRYHSDDEVLATSPSSVSSQVSIPSPSTSSSSRFRSWNQSYSSYSPKSPIGYIKIFEVGEDDEDSKSLIPLEEEEEEEDDYEEYEKEDKEEDYEEGEEDDEEGEEDDEEEDDE